MIHRIYSRINPDVLLHQIVRAIPEGRTNLCPDEQFLQCAALRLPKGTTFRPHRHITKLATHILPEESWYIVEGSAFIFMYDVDGSFLEQATLNTGDISFTFNGGGHNYEILDDNTTVLEFKVGPYLGVEQDKIFIHEDRLQY